MLFINGVTLYNPAYIKSMSPVFMFIGHQQSKQTDSTAAGLGEVPWSSGWPTYPNPL